MSLRNKNYPLPQDNLTNLMSFSILSPIWIQLCRNWTRYLWASFCINVSRSQDTLIMFELMVRSYICNYNFIVRLKKNLILFTGLNDHFKDLRRSPDIFFTSLIFHFMLASYSNSFALQVLMSQNKKQKYGLAIFPASTLLNHSCNPNTTVVTQKNFQVRPFLSRKYHGPLS